MDRSGPGVGAKKRSMHRISLSPGARTIEMRHPTEAVYYVIEGAAEVRDPGNGSVHRVISGSMIHVDPGTRYFFQTCESGAEVLGGPCPPDPDLYAHLKQTCPPPCTA